MSVCSGVLLVERLSKATAFSALLGANWNVICVSGSLPEPVFHGDVCQVEVAPRQRLQISPQLAQVRERLRQVEVVVIATDPTMMGERAAQFIATVLEMQDPRRIDLIEVSEAGLARAMARARRIDMPRIGRRLRELQRSASLNIELRQQFKSIMGRDNFVPGPHERILLAEVVGRERSIRLAGRPGDQAPALSFEDWTAYPLASNTAMSLAATRLAEPRQVFARVTSCNTVAHPDPAPEAMDYCSLVRFAGHRLGIDAASLQEHAYDLYLRGMVTFPFTASRRLDSVGVRAACRLARSRRQPVRDEAELLAARPRRARGMAIRPTDMFHDSIAAPEVLRELYAMIQRRCLLSVLEPSIAKERRIVFELQDDGKPVLFEARSYVGMPHGWRAVAGSDFAIDGDDCARELPILNAGERFIAELTPRSGPSHRSASRLEESDLASVFTEQSGAECSEWFAALRNLSDGNYVRIREGVIMATSFGVSVMRALDDSQSRTPSQGVSEADTALPRTAFAG